MSVVRYKDKDGNVRFLESLRIEGEDGWRPEPDWWDIDSILERDIEDFPAKMIVLLTDGLDEMTFKMSATNKIVKIKTSDGAEYTESVTHVWDKMKDKECMLGYRTRFYIVYFSDMKSTITYDELPFSQNKYSNLSVVLKDLDLTVVATMHANFIQVHSLLESIKFINSTLIEGNGSLFTYNYSLRNIDMSKVYINSGRRAFMSCNSLLDFTGLNVSEKITDMFFMFNGVIAKYIPYIDTFMCTDFQYAFAGNSKLQRIESLDFFSALNVANTFWGCSGLRVIGNVSNIKVSGLDFSPCVLLSYDTLIRVLNALYDYSEDTETHTITLGSANLAKLTDEELAIAQNKGWTIS